MSSRFTDSGRLVGATIVALAVFGVVIAIRATVAVAHGGVHDFDDAFNYPGWSVVHFVSASIFAVILPFQLWPVSRKRYPQAHRIAGRIAAGCGVIFSATGLLLPFVMPDRPLGERVFMVTVACVIPGLLLFGIDAARRGDYGAHRRWMMRATAGAMGPLTQRAIFPLLAAAGIDSMARFWDLFLTAGWLSVGINFVIAEWWIQRKTWTRTDDRALAATPRASLPLHSSLAKSS